MAKSYQFSKTDDNRMPIIFLGIVLVLIVIVGGALIFILSTPQLKAPPPIEVQNPTNNQNNITVTPPTCDDGCLYNRALGNKSVADCKMINGTTLAQTCYQNLANVSLEACKAVTNTSIQTKCITAFAVAQNDSSICNTLGNSSGCKKTVDPCSTAVNKNLCNAVAKNDSKRCDSDYDCLIKYGMQTKDASICTNIPTIGIAGACKSATTRSDKCIDLPSGGQKDYCYALTAEYTNDYLTCTQITADTNYALQCYSNLAINLRNLSVCDNGGITINNLWSCYKNYSLGTQDLTGCKRIDPLATTSSYLCVDAFAKKYGDPSACQVITDSLSERSTCYQGAIIYFNQNLNVSTCSGVVTVEWKNKCYTESAKKANNVSICNYIDGNSSRETCQIAYSVNRTNSSS
ncbi:hypothetical protein HZC07_05115 [Candidatus Micrarchaeota archaeon]|nr:hypothetical protein [Candidatus Micrarchaeota archaeon]